MKNNNLLNQPYVLSIIVTFNGEQWIRKCLGSLVNSIVPVKIIVIDNGSSDGTIEIIKNEFSSVELIESEENLGFGKANNIGIEYGLNNGFSYFFLLNQDAWIKPDAILFLIKAHENHPTNGILSPVHLNGDGNLLDYKFFDYVCESSQRKFVSDSFLKNGHDEIYALNFVNAAAWLVSIDCIKTVGGFDPLFQHYGEDDNYVNRVFFKGFSLGVVPAAVAFHDREKRTRNRDLFEVKKELRKLLIKFTNPGNTFTLYSFFKQNLVLLYIFIRTALALNFNKCSAIFNLMIKFTLSFKLIKKSRRISLKEFAFINTQPSFDRK